MSIIKVVGKRQELIDLYEKVSLSEYQSTLAAKTKAVCFNVRENAKWYSNFTSAEETPEEGSSTVYQLPQDQETIYRLLGLPLETMQETQFEVGDVVKILNRNASPLKLNTLYEVKNVGNTMITVWDATKTDCWYFRPEMVKLIRKASQQEIIGYELLKDLPGIRAGAKGQDKASDGSYAFGNVGTPTTRFSEILLQDTTWFRPIYKPKETVVSISGGREVVVKEGLVVLFTVDNPMRRTHVGSATALQVKGLYDVVNPVNKDGKQSMQLLSATVKYGCQELTKADIEAVYKTLNK